VDTSIGCCNNQSHTSYAQWPASPPNVVCESSHLAFGNWLEDCNFDFSRVIGNHFCTSCGNLVRFSSVTQSLRYKNALAFDNEVADRKSAFKIRVQIWWTSVQIICGFMLLKRAIFAAICPEFDDDRHLSRWRFQMEWKVAILIPAE